MNTIDFSVERFREAQGRYEEGWRKIDECLYRFVSKHPKHSAADLEYVCPKIIMVNRVYQANVHLKIPEYDLAEHLSNLAWLDEGIDKLDDGSGFVASLGRVVDFHRRLVTAAREWSGAELEAFFSKYLHFHCPNIVPIYDSRAWKSLGLHFRATRRRKGETYYENFCKRFLRLYEQAQTTQKKGLISGVDVRSLDYYLYLGQGLEAGNEQE